MFLFNRKYHEYFSFWVMVFSVVLLPLFKGGNYPGAMSCFLLAMGLVFLLSFMQDANEKPINWLAVWLAVSFSVITHVFVFPIFLNSERFFVEGIASDVSSLLGGESLSKIRVLEVWSYFSVMWIFTWRVSLMSRSQVGILLTVLLFVSLFQALFGITHLITGGENVLGLWVKEYYLGDATGTFVNRNHFSGMLAIASPLVLSGLLISRPLIFPMLSRGKHFFIAVIYSMIILLALISSHSRMGLVAGVFGVFVFLFVLLKPEGAKSEQSIYSRWKLILSAFVLMFLFATWFGFADILQRYVKLSGGNARLNVWTDMFSMPLGVWFFGIGPGQFEDVFQVIKPSYSSVRFVYAHNDYLEFVFEFGLLCSAIIFSAVIFWFKSLQLADGYSVVKPGVWGALSAIGLHSLVDFNLQVPASALCFCFAVGLLVNPRMREQKKNVIKSNQSDEDVSGGETFRSKFHWPRSKREWLAFLRSE